MYLTTDANLFEMGAWLGKKDEQGLYNQLCVPLKK